MRGIGLAAVLALAGAAASPPDGASRNHRVDIRELVFQPRDLVVAPGDTVTWVNDDIVAHTVTTAGPGWDSGQLSRGETFVRVVESSGELRYLCRYHPTMTGTLTVR